jgi:adenosylmethionine-8-amino-7-oxononanoate aminotransferase
VIFALDLNIEMDRYGDLRDQLLDFFLSHGIFLRPLGNTIYIQAPYVITSTEMQAIYETIEKALDTL